MLMVLAFCSISLLRENLTGVPLFVSCGACSISSALSGVVATLLTAPRTNLLVDPRKTLLMRPIVLSPSCCDAEATLLVLEELFGWLVDYLLLSTSWNITFLSKADTLLGSRAQLPFSSSERKGSKKGGGLLAVRFGLVRARRDGVEVVCGCWGLLEVFSCLLMILFIYSLSTANPNAIPHTHVLLSNRRQYCVMGACDGL